MPYHYLEDMAIADVAFEASGSTREELFIASCDATLNVMVEDLNTVFAGAHRTIRIGPEKLDLLLYRLLSELVYLKDAESLLLRVSKINFKEQSGEYSLEAEACGEAIDPSRHQLNLDVKAVTLHCFLVEEGPGGWKARVVLDI
jgi:SHS2 domain-containing protein